jgi:hypothetical protein
MSLAARFLSLHAYVRVQTLLADLSACSATEAEAGRLELQEKLAGTLETPVSLYSFTQFTPTDAELAHGCLAYVLLRFDPKTKAAKTIARNKQARG